MIVRKSAARVLMSPVAVVVAMAMILGLASPARASVAAKGQTVVTGAEAKAAVDVVMAKVAAGDIAVPAAPISALNTSKATVLAIDSDKGVFKYVILPVGGGYSLVSNLAVVFAPGGAVAQYSETLFSKNSAGNFQIAQYTNGKMTKSEDIGLAYRTDAELLKGQKNQEVAQPASVGAAASCLAAVLGVSGFFAYLIVAACAGACAASETGVTIPICVACIAAYAAFGSASVGAVVACFNLL